jgi:hypothetical protein
MNFLIYGIPPIVVLTRRSMTHGPLFWKTYNILKKEMAALDAKGYTGEGFYSRPYSLTSNIPITRNVAPEEVPENLCGGSWQRQRRRRRRETGERKKKFKGEGLALGEDEGRRRLLENGKVTASKVLFLAFEINEATSSQIKKVSRFTG